MESQLQCFGPRISLTKRRSRRKRPIPSNEVNIIKVGKPSLDVIEKMKYAVSEQTLFFFFVRFLFGSRISMDPEKRRVKAMRENSTGLVRSGGFKLYVFVVECLGLVEVGGRNLPRHDCCCCCCYRRCFLPYTLPRSRRTRGNLHLFRFVMNA